MLIRRVHFHGGILAGFWGPFRGGLICLGRLTKCIKLWEESVEGDFFLVVKQKFYHETYQSFSLEQSKVLFSNIISSLTNNIK